MATGENKAYICSCVCVFGDWEIWTVISGENPEDWEEEKEKF